MHQPLARQAHAAAPLRLAQHTLSCPPSLPAHVLLQVTACLPSRLPLGLPLLCVIEKVHSEDEVAALLRLSQRHRVPVTFRAAGTSLSGQAVTDSILIKVCASV